MQIFNFSRLKAGSRKPGQFFPPPRDPARGGAISNKRNGFTLVEALVGVALVTIVFTGIIGVYRLGLKVIGVSKNKVVATAIANATMETIRALPYASVGVKNAVLPNAAGILDSASTTVSNNVFYLVTTSVQYVVDPADGLGAADTCNLDYKNVRVNVSWGGNFSSHIEFSTDVMPPTLAQEAQSCQSQPGGILTVTAFDSSGALIPSPLIEVNNVATPAINDSATPASGKYSFPLPVGAYRIQVSKEGYSTTRTYGSDEVAQPNDPDLMVFNGGVTAKSLSIDRSATISVDGISPDGQNGFSDSFADQTQISDLYSTQINAGSITLAGPPYDSSGDAVSSQIYPGDLVLWDEFTFSDIRPPLTDITYQILYYDGSAWQLVPDQYVGGNSSGLSVSPVQLSSLDVASYPRLEIKANLSSSDTLVSPQVKSWQVTWVSKTGVPVPNASFHLQGQKTIGKDANGVNVYKYSQNLALNGGARLDLNDMENDLYTFSTDPAAGFNLSGIDPSPQPVNVAPEANVPVKLYLQPQNSFLLTIQDQDTLRPVTSAAVHLTNAGIGYDTTQYSNVAGQTFFAPLKAGTYSMEIVVPGYENTSSTVAVSGEKSDFISIKQN